MAYLRPGTEVLSEAGADQSPDPGFSVEPDDVIRIGKDLKGAFDKLCGMYPTAKEFAKEANLSTSTISLLKSGKRRLTVDRLIRLCKDCGKKYIVV